MMTSLLIEAAPATKRCAKCGRELPVSEFNKKRNSRDGLQDTCRKCFSDYNRERYASDRERFKSQVKRYRSENPDRELKTRLKACKKNPTARNAYKVVDAALRAGVITRPDVCYGCGCSSSEHRIEAHHHDYSKSLDVIWLCTPCHRRMDMRRQEREMKEGKE